MGRKFTVFALFYFVFEGKFKVQAPRGGYIRRVFCVTILAGLYKEGLIFGILRYNTEVLRLERAEEKHPCVPHYIASITLFFVLKHICSKSHYFVLHKKMRCKSAPDSKFEQTGYWINKILVPTGFCDFNMAVIKW